MELKDVFQYKDNWKKETFEHIKSDLLSIKHNRFIQYDQSSATHLVCLYGKSQVGKTTLILNMIGLKEEWKKNVSEILRGGVKRGNSSTSTAIIYSQNLSDDKANADKYGIRIEALNSSEQSGDFDYYTPQEMVVRLQNIREQVEKNEFSSNYILHISIPQAYFSTSLANDKITILDLPGVESRNRKEEAHVVSLMTRYIPLSSVCIIACPANAIQSFEHEEISKEYNWKRYPTKFLIVLTKSYSDGSIKSYFKAPREKRSGNFENYVVERYNAELSKILGKNNNFEIYPLDLGDSYERLVTEEIKNEEDRQEIKSTRDRVLTTLKKSIVSHKGNLLLSTIKGLHDIIEQVDEKKIAKLTEISNNLISEMNENSRKLSFFEAKNDELNKEISNLQTDESEIDKLCKDIESLDSSISKISQELLSSVKKAIKEKNLSKRDNLNDKKKVCLTTIYDTIYNNLKQCIDENIISPMEKHLHIDLSISMVVNSIFKTFKITYEEKLYPKRTIFGLGSSKVPLSEAYKIIQSIDGIIIKEVSELVINPCIKIIKKKKKEIKAQKKRLHIDSEKIIVRIEEINKKNEQLKKTDCETNEEIKVVKQQKKDDEETLNQYLKYAEIAFSCQKDDIIQKINSNINKEERLMYLLLLGIIEKEYRTLINASYE